MAVAIVAVLVIVLFPVFPTHGKARAIACISNLKQIGLAMAQYQQDYDEHLPPRQSVDGNRHLVSWRAEIFPYLKSRQVFACPSNITRSWHDIENDGFDRSYAVNSSGGGRNNIGGPFNDAHPYLRQEKLPTPESTIIIVESTAAFNDYNPLFPAAFAEPTRRGWRTGHLFCGHSGDPNVLYADYHAKGLRSPLDTLTTLPWNASPGTKPLNGWTIDGSAFSPTDEATARSTIQYGLSQQKNARQ